MKKSVYAAAALSMMILLAVNADAAQLDSREQIGKKKTGDRPAGSRALSTIDGEVEGIDSAGNYVILKHGPIRNLNMSAMTMAFAVKDPAMLAGLKVGDRVKFTAENVGEVVTITSINIQN